MRFVSIYIPSYTHQKGSAKEFCEKYWRIALLVLALHAVVFSLLAIKPKPRTQFNDELVIDLSQPIIAPKIPRDPVREEGRFKAPVKKSAPQIEQAPITAPQNVESPKIADSTPVVKFNEEPTKSTKVDRIDKSVSVAVIEKPEEKKVQIQIDTPLQAQAETKLAESTATALPAPADKKNKDKDAPEIPPASKAGSAPSTAASDSANSAAVSSTPSASSSSRSSAGNSANSSSAASVSEMQAQVSSPKVISGSSGGGGGTADADYKAESLRNAQPRYPIYSRKMHQEGVVIVSAEVLTDGSPTDIRLAASSGIKLLDEAALETIKQWHFIPAKKDGIPYVQRLRIPVTFSLNNR